MNRLFKTAILLAAFAGFQVAGTIGASASQSGLLQYAKDPTVKEVAEFAPIEVASWRSRRRNRIIGGVVAAGAAAIILNEAARSNRRRYRRRYSYPGRRACRIWAARCDRGRVSQCSKWNRRCR